MTQKDKELLLKDLCARLPYHVICTDSLHGDSSITEIDVVEKTVYCYDFDEYVELDKCKPYLRPMSSMTEEERIDSLNYAWKDDYGRLASYNENIPKYIDFLNSHHFDYRGLIDKGLALEAPEGMYK